MNLDDVILRTNSLVSLLKKMGFDETTKVHWKNDRVVILQSSPEKVAFLAQQMQGLLQEKDGTKPVFEQREFAETARFEIDAATCPDPAVSVLAFQQLLHRSFR